MDLTKKGIATGLPPAAAAKAGKAAETPTRKGPAGAQSGDAKGLTVNKGSGGGNPGDAGSVGKPKGPTPGSSLGGDSSTGKVAPKVQDPK